MNEDNLWDIRAFVYRHFAETARPPRVEEVASRFGLTHEEASSAFEELHRRHALYLKPSTQDILMASPFSGVETPFRVRANDKTYFANCAWDSLGIPAALHIDAEIEARCAQTGNPIQLRVMDYQVEGSDALEKWLASQKGERGAVLSMPQLWELSQRWYRDRMLPEYHGRSMEQVQEIFREVGLTSGFWLAM